MSNPVDLLGNWQTRLPEGPVARLAVVGQGERFAVIYSEADQWDALAFAYDEESARRCAELIGHLGNAREHVRVGGPSILSGADTEHPGAEWVTPAEEVDNPDPAVRMMGAGTRRLWVVPSTDGEVLGLLEPSGDPRDIAEFVSVAAADAFITFLDARLSEVAARG